MHRLDNSVDYVLDEKKASRSQNADSLQAAVDYALNKDKTEQDLFCSAIGCTLDSAFEDMCQIKKMWHKEKGVQGFHLVQSFAAGEVTPELAHQIGRELADRLLGGRFQVVISTHLNTRHMLDDKYDLMRHPNIKLTEDGGAAPYDYTQAKDAADDLGGDWKNYEILDELEKM